MFVFRWIDGLLLYPAQWFSDKTQTLFGITKFKLQKWALVICLITETFAIFQVSSNVSAVMVWLFVAAIIMWIIRQDEKEEAEFLRSGKLRYSVWNAVSVRLIIVCVYVFLWIITPLSEEIFGLLIRCAQTCNVAWVYFSACVPKPPCKSKVRQWCEKGLQWLKNHKPEPELVPEPS